MNLTLRSLGFVDEEGYLFELEVEESIFLVHCVTPEVVSQDYVPVLSVVLVQKLLEVFRDLRV